MEIESAVDYQDKENRLKDIRDALADLVKSENVDLTEVVNLRDEAKTLAVALKDFLNKTFEAK